MTVATCSNAALEDLASVVAVASADTDDDYPKAKRYAVAALDALYAEPDRFDPARPAVLQRWLTRQVRRSVPFGLTPFWWWVAGQLVRLIVAEIIRRLTTPTDGVGQAAADVLTVARDSRPSSEKAA